METIQVVIDAKLLQASDRAAKKAKLNRSQLVRLALHEHLRRVRIQEAEQRDQRGYEKPPQSKAASAWEAEAVAGGIALRQRAPLLRIPRAPFYVFRYDPGIWFRLGLFP